MKIAVDTYGCTHNQADGELISNQIKKIKNAEESNVEESDIVILNTCAVKNKTQSRMLSKIKQYREQGKKVLVAGCLPRVNTEILEELQAPMVDINSIEKIPKAIMEIQKGKKPVHFSEKHLNKLRMDQNETKNTKKTYGIVPIAEGCLGNCSYCGVKNSRGNLTSYPEKDILKEAKRHLAEGKKEIYITAEDTGCYGKDLEEKTNLPRLIQALANLEGEFKVRVGMMNPEHTLQIKEELTKALQNEKIYKFLHIPVQSGSNKVLKDMNRRYTVQKFLELVNYLKKEVKDINLATDIIVGYPTERKEHFQETIELIKNTELDIVNISRFHPRPNTVGNTLKQLTSQTLKERSIELTKQVKEISKNKNKQYLGKTMETLVTETDEENSFGRTNNYKKVKLEKTNRDKVKVKITNASSRGLTGKQINT